MRPATAVLLSLIGLFAFDGASSFGTNFIKAGSNAAQGALSTGNSLFGAGLGGYNQNKAAPRRAPTNSFTGGFAPATPATPSAAAAIPDGSQEADERASVVNSLRGAAESLGGGPNSIVGSAVATTRGAANSATSAGTSAFASAGGLATSATSLASTGAASGLSSVNSALSSVTSALSLSSIAGVLLSNPIFINLLTMVRACASYLGLK